MLSHHVEYIHATFERAARARRRDGRLWICYGFTEVI